MSYFLWSGSFIRNLILCVCSTINNTMTVKSFSLCILKLYIFFLRCSMREEEAWKLVVLVLKPLRLRPRAVRYLTGNDSIVWTWSLWSAAVPDGNCYCYISDKTTNACYLTRGLPRYKPYFSLYRLCFMNRQNKQWRVRRVRLHRKIKVSRYSQSVIIQNKWKRANNWDLSSSTFTTALESSYILRNYL